MPPDLKHMYRLKKYKVNGLFGLNENLIRMSSLDYTHLKALTTAFLQIKFKRELVLCGKYQRQ